MMETNMDMGNEAGNVSHPKILIVEDDERLASLSKDYLESNGMDVGVVGSKLKKALKIKKLLSSSQFLTRLTKLF